MKLSILIPTLNERPVKRDALVFSLHTQLLALGYPLWGIHEKSVLNSGKIKTYNYKEVEIIYYADQKQITIGAKRNWLTDLATGDYLCMVDDDDVLSPYYIRFILEALQKNPGIDCCSLKGFYTSDGSLPEVFEHSTRYRAWNTNPEHCAVRYERYVNHLNTIKTSIAKQLKFEELRHGEDHKWSTALQESGLLRSEAHIPEVLYYYNHISQK